MFMPSPQQALHGSTPQVLSLDEGPRFLHLDFGHFSGPPELGPSAQERLLRSTLVVRLSEAERSLHLSVAMGAALRACTDPVPTLNSIRSNATQSNPIQSNPIRSHPIQYHPTPPSPPLSSVPPSHQEHPVMGFNPSIVPAPASLCRDRRRCAFVAAVRADVMHQCSSASPLYSFQVLFRARLRSGSG